MACPVCCGEASLTACPCCRQKDRVNAMTTQRYHLPEETKTEAEVEALKAPVPEVEAEVEGSEMSKAVVSSVGPQQLKCPEWL